MSRETEHRLLEWLAANETRFIGYSISIASAYWLARAHLSGPLSLGQFRRVALYAHTTGYLRDWRGAPPTRKADLPGQEFFDFVAA